MQYDALIIGAGHNGLVAAAYLARSGMRVLVLERREIIGGAAVTEEVWPGWQVSTASYVCSLLHPRVIDELELRKHGYEAYRKSPMSFTPLLDGRSLLLGHDCKARDAEIAAFDRSDVEGFARFSAHADRLGAMLFDAMLDEEPSRDRFDGDALADMNGSAAFLVERYVRTPVLQATLVTDGLIGTAAGPRDPGTGYVLAHHYAGRALGPQGAWGFVRGGMGAISNAAAGAARAAGAEIRTGATVARIDVRDGVVTGVTLDDGTEIEAAVVLSNADPKTTYLQLLDAAHAPPALREKAERWRCEGVSLKLNLALGELPNYTARPSRVVADHHRATIHIAPTIDYLQTAADEAREGRVSRAPMLECFMQTPTDPDLAPPGKHLLSIFAQYYPYRRSDGPWTQAKKDEAADAIIATLAQYAPNLPAAVEARQVLAPVDLEARFGLAGGHIFHGELLPGQLFEERFGVRSPVAGLYLCGSGTHPGGCVSGAPGYRAAAATLADLQQRKWNSREAGRV